MTRIDYWIGQGAGRPIPCCGSEMDPRKGSTNYMIRTILILQYLRTPIKLLGPLFFTCPLFFLEAIPFWV